MPIRVTPSYAAELLGRHAIRAGRSHGQHFLVDPNTVDRIVRLSGITADDTVLEIGPGIGSLSVGLSAAVRRVVAVEIDEGVVDALREVIDGLDNVELVVADAMDADLAALVGGPAKLVANLPYNVATPLFLKVLDEVPAVTGGLVMVQRELGERWAAKPRTKAYSAVTLHAAFHAEVAVAGDVPRTVFMPQPNVDSVLVSFTRRAHPPVDVDDARAFFAFLQKSFAHRRKTLRNSLSAGGYDDAVLRRALDDVGLTERARPEEIDLATFAGLFAAVGA